MYLKHILKKFVISKNLKKNKTVIEVLRPPCWVTLLTVQTVTVTDIRRAMMLQAQTSSEKREKR